LAELTVRRGIAARNRRAPPGRRPILAGAPRGAAARELSQQSETLRRQIDTFLAAIRAA